MYFHLFLNFVSKFCVCVCVCVYIYIYAYTHIYIHTHARAAVLPVTEEKLPSGFLSTIQLADLVRYIQI